MVPPFRIRPELFSSNESTLPELMLIVLSLVRPYTLVSALIVCAEVTLMTDAEVAPANEFVALYVATWNPVSVTPPVPE